MDESDDWMALADKDTTTMGSTTIVVEEDTPQVLGQPLDNLEVGKANPANPQKLAQKEKQKELNKKFEEKKQVYEDTFGGAGTRKIVSADDRKKMEELSKALDQRNTIDLFGEFIKENEPLPQDEEAYINNAKKIVEVLLKEDRKLYIQEFVKEILQGLYVKLTAKEFQEIYNKTQVLLNNKQKDEKPQTGKKKKESKAPVLNVSKGNVGAKNVKYQGGEEEEVDEDEEYTGPVKFSKDDDFM